MGNLPLLVYTNVKERFDRFNSVEEWEDVFNYYLEECIESGPKTRGFILGCYNPIVLDKKPFDFKRFKLCWNLRYSSLLKERFDSLFKTKYLKEMGPDKDIIAFFRKYCTDEKTGSHQSSFCTKLWHCLYPEHFPILDKNVAVWVGIDNRSHEEKITSLLKGFKMLIEKEKPKLDMIRKSLANQKFSYVRINEISDMRVIDLALWGVDRKEKQKD